MPHKTVHIEASQHFDFRRWTIGKDVQAYLSNRLVVLVSKAQVLSDKVKGLTSVVLKTNAMVGVKELNASEPL